MINAIQFETAAESARPQRGYRALTNQLGFVFGNDSNKQRDKPAQWWEQLAFSADDDPVYSVRGRASFTFNCLPPISV